MSTTDKLQGECRNRLCTDIYFDRAGVHWIDILWLVGCMPHLLCDEYESSTITITKQVIREVGKTVD
jgi:hypothetical protein